MSPQRPDVWVEVLPSYLCVHLWEEGTWGRRLWLATSPACALLYVILLKDSFPPTFLEMQGNYAGPMVVLMGVMSCTGGKGCLQTALHSKSACSRQGEGGLQPGKQVSQNPHSWGMAAGAWSYVLANAHSLCRSEMAQVHSIAETRCGTWGLCWVSKCSGPPCAQEQASRGPCVDPRQAMFYIFWVQLCRSRALHFTCDQMLSLMSY